MGKIGLLGLVHIRFELYFEVKDCEVFGGVGSIGYSEHKVECDWYKVEITEEYINEQTKFMANILHVPVENLRLISKEEFDEKTEDDDN